MRRLLTILPLTLLSAWLLSGCVTHYYPAYDQTPQPNYSASAVYGTGDVAASVAVRYYPWWSLDYLYLGYGYPGSRFSVGFSWGFGGYYSPWYSPWYDRYRFSAWYAPVWYAPAWYGPSYGWHDPYWHYRYHHHYRPYHGGRHPRYVHDGYRPPRRGHGTWDGVDDRIYDRDRMVGDRGPGRGGARPVDTSRYVSVARGAEAGQRGMEVRRGSDAKPGRSRTGPVETRNPGASLAAVNDGRAEPRVVSRRGDGAEVRSRVSETRKPTALRTQPTRGRSDPSVSLAPASRIEPATWTASGNRSVSSRPERKVTASRTQPSGRAVSPSSRRPVAAAPVNGNRASRAAPVARAPIAAAPSRSTPSRYDAPRVSPRAVSPPTRSAPAPSSPPPRVSSPPPRSSTPRSAPPPAASPPPRSSVSAPPPSRSVSAPRAAPEGGGRRGNRSDRRR